jgi:hypothetical protein
MVAARAADYHKEDGPMAATLMFGGDWRNQFSLTYDELEQHARDAKTFERTRSTGLEVEY